MKVAAFLESRRRNWQELEELCGKLENGHVRKLGPVAIARFAALYRSVCADLALADAYQLPPNTVQYLHRLVGRAHNQLYRSRMFEFKKWGRQLVVDVPRTVFGDRCVQMCFCFFWGIFLLSGFLAASPGLWPAYADQLLGKETMDGVQEVFSNDLGRSGDEDTGMAAFYIRHNTSIGLKCFAYMLLIVPGFYVTIYNAAILGGIFGFMARSDTVGRENFFEFVTAHAPFELTAIVLSAGAGLKLGISWIVTNGQSRTASLQQAGREAMPVIGAVMILFFLAAMIEGFLSPSPAPYWVKASVAVISVLLLVLYFVGLGYPRR